MPLLQQIARGMGISDPRKGGMQRHLHLNGPSVMYVRAEKAGRTQCDAITQPAGSPQGICRSKPPNLLCGKHEMSRMRSDGRIALRWPMQIGDGPPKPQDLLLLESPDVGKNLLRTHTLHVFVVTHTAKI